MGTSFLRSLPTPRRRAQSKGRLRSEVESCWELRTVNLARYTLAFVPAGQTAEIHEVLGPAAGVVRIGRHFTQLQPRSQVRVLTRPLPRKSFLFLRYQK